jgi:hypothetical protein
MIAEKDHLVSQKETHVNESDMNAASVMDRAQSEIREIKAHAEAQVRAALDESRKDLEDASIAMNRIQDNAEKAIAEVEEIAAAKIASAEQRAESEAQARRESNAELETLRSTIIEVTQDVDVRVM